MNEHEDEILFHIDYTRFIEYNFNIQEMLIILMLLDGYSITEISERNALCRVHTTRLVKRIREKFSSFLGFT